MKCPGDFIKKSVLVLGQQIVVVIVSVLAFSEHTTVSDYRAIRSFCRLFYQVHRHHLYCPLPVYLPAVVSVYAVASHLLVSHVGSIESIHFFVKNISRIGKSFLQIYSIRSVDVSGSCASRYEIIGSDAEYGYFMIFVNRKCACLVL